MTLHSLAVKICKLEGKKKQTDIAQCKEIIRIICELEADAIVDVDTGVYQTTKSPCHLIIGKANKIFEKRQKQKKKKKKKKEKPLKWVDGWGRKK